jgi:hypothetical protein
VLVPVVAVGGVAMSVVQIVHVIAVLDGLVAAAGPVLVLVVLVDEVRAGVALVPMTFVFPMYVAVMEVVRVVSVGDSDVAAAGAMLVRVLAMLSVSFHAPRSYPRAADGNKQRTATAGH